ncbi:hypothetical protein bb8_p12 [Bordetella phage vB_BbrP_BB8]|uniref:Uncharacterized protein n=1 Tax=Bordetella phage vB_BbrP_BB8 TaxID=2587820 RepID=A0A4Y5TNP4_9CAUD|nr:hypothetical protein bb8_p12 [Bordetella phage vB_BbrP_BB8]
MWSYCVQFVDELGQVLKSTFVSASSPHHAKREALRGGVVPDDCVDIEVTRLS